METLNRIISEHPYFRGMRDEQLDLIAGCASNVRFKAGEPLFLEGGEANQFFIIREGKVALEVHTGTEHPIVIQTVGSGEVLGWSWLIPPHRWRFDARALEGTRAFALDGACLRRKCEEDHDLGFELLKRFSTTMAERLQATRRQLLDVYHAYHKIVEART
jgi:CRP-like cAMP-binding protein